MKTWLMAIAAILALSIPAVKSEAEPAASLWKIGHVRGEGSTIDREIRALTEKITQESGGKIAFDIYPASKLGDYTVVQESCAFGDVQMYVAPFGTTTEKRLALPFTPYLVMNWAEAKHVYAPEGLLMQKMAGYLEAQNLKLLGGWPVYFGGVVLTKAPPVPDDPEVSKELIIRVPPIRSFELTASALGYTPYPITWMYARSGLTTGMVQGMIGGGAEGYLGLKESAKFYLALNDHFEYWFVYMNLDLWKSLSEKEQGIIQQAVRDMESQRFDTAEADEQANLKRLAEQGTNVITFTEEELAKMAEKVRQEVWPILSKELGSDFDELVSTITR
jgi:TRAP-type transport system periplasmic protein